MIIRTGFLLVALVSAIKVGQIKLTRARKRSSSIDEHRNASFHGGRIGKENCIFDASHVDRREKEEMVETCGSESLLEGVSDKPEEIDCKMEEFSAKENSVHEINCLKNFVKEKEQRRENLELKLIELYCLKEQQSRMAKLQKLLTDKMAEMDMLRNMLNKLQSEREELCEEVKLNQLARKQLEIAKLTILELKLKTEFDAEGHLRRLREQVSGFVVDGTLRKDTKSNKKINAIKEVELEAMKMKRRNKELQLEKRELGVKLDAIQARIAELSGMTEDIIVARMGEEMKRLKGVNHHLTGQVEELHKNRFSILEELVYQRRLNSCLKFELRDHHNPQPRNVSRKLCFQSEDESKTSSLYPGSEISSIESDEIKNTTICSSSCSPSVKSKKFSLIFNIKRWGRSSSDSSSNVENSSLRRKPGLFRRFSMSYVSSSTSGQRSEGKGTIFKGKKNEVHGSSSPEFPHTRRVRRVSFNDSLNSVAYTSDYSPVSVQGIQNNDPGVADSFSDWSDIKTSSSFASTLQEKKSQMPLGANDKQSKSSRDMNNQDPHSNKIETQIELKKGIVHTEFSSPGKPNVSSKFSEQMVNLIAAFSLIIFLLLVYFSPLSISRTRKFYSFGT